MWQTLVSVSRHTYSSRRFLVSSSRLINLTSKIPGYQLQKVEVTRFLYTQTQNINDRLQNDSENSQASCSFTYRSHTCGELRLFNEGERVALCGWVQFIRLSKFLLLRDSYGTIQCVVSDSNINVSDIALETIVKVEGTVISRPKDMINRSMKTGEIEIVIENLEVLNNAEKLPFNLRDYQKPKEQLRLQYRYIDLRFPEMQYNLRQRSKILHNMRRFLIEKHNFCEVETPTLFCRTPGGAREFIVPTHHSGLFYSLVQSPQQFKQMLMSGGVDRYFQVARCYRDETTRPDRQPEFTQLDIELSFTNLNGVLLLIEQMLHETFLSSLPKPPFQRLKYKNAIEQYGSDKPDTRYELKLKNITNLISNQPTENEGAFLISYSNKLGKLTSRYKDKIKELKKKYEVRVTTEEKLIKEFGTSVTNSIKSVINCDETCIVALGNAENACLCLGELRILLAQLLKSKDLLSIKEEMEPLWVVDFPLFVQGENGLVSCHHPFTAPHPEDMHLLQTDPLKVRSLAYDLVLNGNEVGGGSIRIHNAVLQKEILRLLNISSSELKHFLDALRSGCPPHGGIALGIDRLMAIACEAESIRDVIAFPKTREGKDPLSGAPNTLSDDDKKYYHIAIVE